MEIIQINTEITRIMKLDDSYKQAKDLVKKSSIHSFCVRRISELRSRKQELIRNINKY